MIKKRIGFYVLLAVATATLLTSFSMMNAQTDSIQMAEAQITPNAMGDITNQIVMSLTNGANPDVQRENINQAESMIFGKPVILETNGVPDTITISDDYDVMTGNIKTALFACSEGVCADPGVAAAAKELADRITYWEEVKFNLELQTTEPACDAANPTTCVHLDRGDEPTIQNPKFTVGTDKIWDGWYREIRSPYFPIYPHPYGFVQQENVIVAPGPIANGECSTIVKEIQGIKSILRPTIIPIWQEPWTSRASIISYQIVWVVDFVPAEFVKNLNYCNVNGSIQTDYEINVIIERELLHFWKYLPGGLQPIG